MRRDPRFYTTVQQGKKQGLDNVGQYCHYGSLQNVFSFLDNANVQHSMCVGKVRDSRVKFPCIPYDDFLLTNRPKKNLRA